MRMNRPQKRYSFFVLFALTLFAAGVIFFCRAFSAAPLNAMEKKSYTKAEEEAKEKQEQKLPLSDSGLQKKCRKIYKKNKKLLVLVNRQKALSENYEPALQAISNGRLMASSLLYSDLREMLSGAAGFGYQYWLASAWRSSKNLSMRIFRCLLTRECLMQRQKRKFTKKRSRQDIVSMKLAWRLIFYAAIIQR